jgi:hypothetical protein
MSANDLKQETAAYQAYQIECPGCGRSIRRAIRISEAGEFRWDEYSCHFCGSSLVAGTGAGDGYLEQRVQNGATVRSPVTTRNDERAVMALSDRLKLLSFVTVIWVAFASISLLLLVAEGEPPESADPYYLSLAGVAVFLLFLPSWFGSWGLISVAVLGKGTTLRGWSLRTRAGDVLLFFFGPIVWTFVFFIGLAARVASVAIPALEILVILAVAILIGLVNLLWGAWRALSPHVASASSER